MKKTVKGALGVAGALFAFSQGAAAEECGKVSIAEMNWASAELMANVDAIILSEGYGCDVEKVPGATTTTFASMNEKGQPDVAPELWTNAVREPLAVATGEGSMVVLNDGPITDLGEGWWITPAFAEAHPDLNTLRRFWRVRICSRMWKIPRKVPLSGVRRVGAVSWPMPTCSVPSGWKKKAGF